MISVVLPTYNEAENIIPLIKQIQNNLKGNKFEIIVVDDNSPDQTGMIARNIFKGNEKIKIYTRKERGLAGAVLWGLKKAKGPVCAVMDTDFNHDPKNLPIMIRELSRSDLVVGSRYVSGGGMENRIRNFVSKIYNRMIMFMLHISTSDNLSGFFLIRKDKLRTLMNIDIFQGYGDYFIRFLYAAEKDGLQIKEVPVFYKNRIVGESKTRFFKIFFDYSRTVVQLWKRSLN